MSGNVVPATGDIQFLSNANSNAVSQVFGLATSNVSLSSLVGVEYNPSVTAAPVFVAPTVPTPLSLRSLAGASLFIPTPNTPTIQLGGSDQIYPQLSGPAGATGKYYIALGTSAGASNAVSWIDVSTNSWNFISGWSRNTLYYVSTFLSNANGRKSLAISNTTAYGLPNTPTVTFSITTPSNWTINWTNNGSTVTVPTQYDWNLIKDSDSSTVASGTVASNITNVVGTTLLAYDTNYSVNVNSSYGNSSAGTRTAAQTVPALGAPVLANFSTFPNRYSKTLTVNWGAVTGATVYDILIGTTEVARDVAATSKAIDISSYTGAIKTVRVQARNAIRTSSLSSPLEFFFSTTWQQYEGTIAFTRSTTHSIICVGGSGGEQYSQWFFPASSYYKGDGSGGPGGLTAVVTTENRFRFYYYVGQRGGRTVGGTFYYYLGGNPGGGEGGSVSVNASGGGGGGYSLVSKDIGQSAVAGYSAGIITLAGGGGGGGGGLENNVIGLSDPYEQMIMVANPGGRGGGGNGSNGTQTAYSVPILNVSTADVYAYGGGGAGTGGIGQASSSDIGGSSTGSGQQDIVGFSRNGNSYKPTNGTIDGVGGKGGRIVSFSYGCGGGGGGGYYGGGGGSVYYEYYARPGVSQRYRFVSAGGGGGGGSSYTNVSITSALTGAPANSGSASGQDGLVFIGERV